MFPLSSFFFGARWCTVVSSPGEAVRFETNLTKRPEPEPCSSPDYIKVPKSETCNLIWILLRSHCGTFDWKKRDSKHIHQLVKSFFSYKNINGTNMCVLQHVGFVPSVCVFRFQLVCDVYFFFSLAQIACDLLVFSVSSGVKSCFCLS